MIAVITGPSGVGKTTLVKQMLLSNPQIGLSVSCTTRRQRLREQPGIDYHFLSQEEFMRRKAAGDFLESAKVHGQLYGTLESHTLKLLDDYHCLLLEIDWRGMIQVKKRFPDAITIFILPPSFSALETRIRNRNEGEITTEIGKRLQNARIEIAECGRFDYRVVNDDLDRALNEIHGILKVARMAIPA